MLHLPKRVTFQSKKKVLYELYRLLPEVVFELDENKIRLIIGITMVDNENENFTDKLFFFLRWWSQFAVIYDHDLR